MPQRTRFQWFGVTALVVLAGAGARLQQPPMDRQLLVAAARGNIAVVKELLAKGANVNTDNGHGVTPLWYAADQANVELVKVLLDAGADPTLKDLEYGKTPLRVASVPWSDVKKPDERAQIVGMMMDKGAGADGEALVDLIRGGHVDAVRAIVAGGRADRVYLNQALEAARRAKQAGVVELLTRAGATEPGPLDSARSPARLKQLVGTFRSQAGTEITLKPSVYEDQLLLGLPGRDPIALLPADVTILRSFDLKVVVTMKPSPLPPPEVTLKEGGKSEVFARVGTE